MTARSFLAVLEVILGGAPPEMGPLIPSVEVSETIWLVAKEQSEHWKTINVASVEPRESEDLWLIIITTINCLPFH